jgi:short-subunit dehydrogenase
MRYRDRVAVVTGAGSGIGRSLTIALTSQGARVAAVDIDRTGLIDTTSRCGGELVTTYDVDVADRNAVISLATSVREDLGPASMVFNNAGVDLFGSVEDMSWDDVEWLCAINLGGVINGTKAFLPQLIESGSLRQPSRLVNVSSAFGLIALAYQSAYSASKFAVRGFTEALRQEMIAQRQPVTVHSVHPGVVRSNFGANMRVADTEDQDGAKRMFDRAALTSTDKAARLILRGADKNRARILIGPDGRIAAALPRILGAGYIGLLGRATGLAKPRQAGRSN